MEDDFLTLETNVFRPLDEADQVCLGTDVLAWKQRKSERSLVLGGSLRRSQQGNNNNANTGVSRESGSSVTPSILPSKLRSKFGNWNSVDDEN